MINFSSTSVVSVGASLPSWFWLALCSAKPRQQFHRVGIALMLSYQPWRICLSSLRQPRVGQTFFRGSTNETIKAIEGMDDNPTVIQSKGELINITAKMLR